MISDVMKRIMDEKNISILDLVDASGLPKRTIDNLLYGVTTNPTIETLKKVADALGCTLNDFMDDYLESGDETLAAHHEEEEWSEEQLKLIENFKEYIKKQ